jgi:hypothetical protein
MRTQPIGSDPASETQRRPAVSLACIAFALVCGGAIAWGLKKYHWAPKVATGVGLSLVVAGGCLRFHRTAAQRAPVPAEQPVNNTESVETEKWRSEAVAVLSGKTAGDYSAMAQVRFGAAENRTAVELRPISWHA